MQARSSSYSGDQAGVHNNYYFLRQLSASLNHVLPGTVVSECFSQNKNELVVRFETHGDPFWLKASLDPAFSCLSFPERFNRARRNSVDLFEQIIGLRVKGIRQFQNERSFAIEFLSGAALLFKMHGNRSNIIFIENDDPVALFQHNQPGDAALQLGTLDRTIDWSYDAFGTHLDRLPSLYFTFGKVVWQYLAQQGFDALPAEDKWHRIQALREMLERPVFYITRHHHQLVLSLVPVGVVHQQYTDPQLALNDFFATYIHQSAFDREKAALLSALRTRLQGSESYLRKTAQKLDEVQRDTNYKTWADLLMAHLHTIDPGTEKITLPDFYEPGRQVEIKLRKDLSPQKNAEVFYRKAKNQHIEIERLQQSLRAKEVAIEKLTADIERVEKAADLKALRNVAAAESVAPKKDEAPLPYHAFEYKGYRIWVGRNAHHNDTLTFKYGYKEDLWLHAKDVAGSHVLVKHQAGKNFPRDVIERAAELAAYNSKRKNESLCPVVVTPRKFVRKRKGDPPGAVVVEKEDVVMVVPRS